MNVFVALSFPTCNSIVIRYVVFNRGILFFFNRGGWRVGWGKGLGVRAIKKFFFFFTCSEPFTRWACPIRSTTC